jgi:hypothetical protein
MVSVVEPHHHGLVTHGGSRTHSLEPITPDVWLESLSGMYVAIPTLDGRLSAMVQKSSSTAVLELHSVCAMMGPRRHGKKVRHKGVV